MNDEDLLQSSRRTTLDFEVIDWRCVNGHLLARVIVGRDKVVLSIKCHRCKHVEEKDVGAIKE